MFNLNYIHGLLNHYEAAKVSTSLSPTDTMRDQWYFQVGRSAVEVILAALAASKLQRVRKVLDIPCGHGRVLRHLVCLFPDAEVHACDLDKAGVNYCASAFGVRPIYSQEELTAVDFGAEYDLIWVGSLFTHTARETTRRWAAHLAKFLSPHGIVVATFHGRWNQHVHKVAPYIGQERWLEILRDYSAQGYGYRDYTRAESHPFIAGSYGVSLAKPQAVVRDLEDIPGVRLYLYLERGWSDTQDVVAYGRPAYDELWPSMKQEASSERF
jgi:SAM-dependent methyltransferase